MLCSCLVRHLPRNPCTWTVRNTLVVSGVVNGDGMRGDTLSSGQYSTLSPQSCSRWAFEEVKGYCADQPLLRLRSVVLHSGTPNPWPASFRIRRYSLELGRRGIARQSWIEHAVLCSRFTVVRDWRSRGLRFAQEQRKFDSASYLAAAGVRRRTVHVKANHVSISWGDSATSILFLGREERSSPFCRRGIKRPRSSTRRWRNCVRQHR